jgi:hypothetical protein
VLGSGNSSFQLVPTDPTAPLVLFAGNSSTFGSLQQFMGVVLQAELSVSKPSAADGSRVVTFVPPAGGKPCLELCRPIAFPWALTKAAFKMPSIGGKVVDDQPPLAYDGPFMRSTLGSVTVRVGSGAGGAIREEFDFASDVIWRLDVAAAGGQETEAADELVRRRSAPPPSLAAPRSSCHPVSG